MAISSSMMASATVDGASCELHFRPEIELVSIVRRFVGAFFARALDREGGERMAVATHELLENAIKYAVAGDTGLRIEIEPGAARTVSIRTWNQTSVEHRAALVEMLRESTAAPDPFAFYIERMKKSATRTDGSGLGLARILAECDMRLSYEIHEDEVCIVARRIASEER